MPSQNDFVENIVSQAKLNNLWWIMLNRLHPIMLSFRNKLNYIFTDMQKQVNKGASITKQDKEKYVNNIVTTYVNVIHDVTDITIKRIVGESGYVVVTNFVDLFITEYMDLYLNNISNFVIKDIFDNIELAKSKLGKDNKKYKEYINYYFDTVCKKKKSKLLSFNEIYRFHNFLYIGIMSKLDCKYKIKIVDPMSLKYKVFQKYEISRIIPEKQGKNSQKPDMNANYSLFLAY